MKRIRNAILILFACLGVFSTFPANAASSLSVKLGGPSAVRSGDEIEITLSIENPDREDIIAVNGTLKYDGAMLTLKEISSDIAGGWKLTDNKSDGSVKFVMCDMTTENPFKVKADMLTATFRVEKAGEFNVTATDVSASAGAGVLSIADAAFAQTAAGQTVNEEKNNSSGNQKDNSYTSSRNNGQNSETDKNNVYDSISLKTLKVANAEITPEFSSDVKIYKAVVPYNVKKLKITAEAVDPTSKVTITGDDLPYIGENITRIVVEAQDGSKRTYKIYTTRQPKEGAAQADEKQEFPWLWIIIGICVLVVLGFVILFLAAKKARNKK